jgi:hypothetical protein
LKDPNTEFYAINYNASELCSERLKEYGDRSVQARINIAPHAYLYPNTDPSVEIKENVLTCIYTTKGKDADFQLSRFCGIEECYNEDGGVKVNRSHFLTSNNIQEVYLHPADHQVMAISPNNGSFLLNMSAPLVSFILVLK